MSLKMHHENIVTSGNRHFPTADLYHEVYEALWPRDPTSWVFMGRAVHTLGAKLFPAWERYTPYGLLPDVSVGTGFEDEDLTEEHYQYANWLIGTRGNDSSYIFRNNQPFDYLNSNPNVEASTEQYWEYACDLSQEEWAIGLGNRRMFSKVQLRIVQEAEAGRLIIGSRPVEGGEPMRHPRDWWFTDNYENRFRSLAIDPNAPFSSDAPDQSVGHHLFVEADGLAALIGEPEPVLSQDLSVRDLGDPSPYLRLMIEVQNLLQIGSATPPKKASVLLEIQSRWTAYDLPASNKLMNTMATLLRSPESQAGRGRKLLEVDEVNKG